MAIGDEFSEHDEDDIADTVYNPNPEVRQVAHINSMETYKKMYKKSIEDPEAFWSEMTQDLFWKASPPGDFYSYNFDMTRGPVSIKWMEGARTNIVFNALDRHIQNGFGDRVAYFWEGNDPGDESQITYKELWLEVCKFANVLRSKGIQKGDTVAICMPMILQLVISMLACARIGAIHCIVFAGFSAESLAGRILDAKCKILVVADGVWRGTKLINIKELSDNALEKCRAKGHFINTSIVYQHVGPPKSTEINNRFTSVPGKRPCYDAVIPFDDSKDIWWHEEMALASPVCEPEWVDAEDPLFMLYTSGSTGAPKGVVHTTGGYMIYSFTTYKYVFDYKPGEVFFGTADIGWVTGHTYNVYGLLLNGATGVIFEGVPVHPDPGRYWSIIEKLQVNKFYAAPTAIRALMKYGDEFVTTYDRSSLTLLGCAGEPINPKAWRWYHNVVGEKRCPIIDTYWQTETGAAVLSPIPGCTPLKPGSATFPMFGVIPVLINDEGKEIRGPGEGYLAFKKPWPGMMRTLWRNHDRFEATYFQKFPGYYVSGDGAIRDEDGYYWVTGRVDDMLNVSGHLLSTAQVESALLEHKAVVESAVVAHPHNIKGQCLYCFVVLKEGWDPSDSISNDLRLKVRAKIGPYASPDFIHYSSGLPKTRSGKVMRRVLRKVAINDRDLGDLSTLADDEIIDELFRTRSIIDA